VWMVNADELLKLGEQPHARRNSARA
jgi:hypothetical protein